MCPELIVSVHSSDQPHRYHDSTGSFASLATQSSQLSQSPSALHGRDKAYGFNLKDLKPQQLHETRTVLGLSQWDGDHDD